MTTAPALRLGQELLTSDFAERATLVRQSAGARNDHGEWVPGVTASKPVTLVSWPLSGEERRLLPEGLRQKNVRKFCLNVAVTALLEGKDGKDGDIIVYNGNRWRARIADDWGGFWEVSAELMPRSERQSHVRSHAEEIMVGEHRA